MNERRRITNPWTWQDQFGFVQANTVAAQRLVFCAGQASIDADGNPVHGGDLSGPLRKSFGGYAARASAAGWGSQPEGCWRFCSFCSCRSIRAIRSSRSAGVNFHLNGRAVAL